MNGFRRSLVNLRFWLSGYTFAQELRFLRGVSVGLVIAAVGMLFAWSMAPRPVDIDGERAKAMAEGYSKCCLDTVSIVAHGGGLDEVIAFMKAKGDTEFSWLVSPTNFYAEGFEDGQ